MTQTSKERRQLAAENKNFGRRWTDARPEPQHSGTILWGFVALLLCAVTGVMLMVVR